MKGVIGTAAFGKMAPYIPKQDLNKNTRPFCSNPFAATPASFAGSSPQMTRPGLGASAVPMRAMSPQLAACSASRSNPVSEVMRAASKQKRKRAKRQLRIDTLRD